ncbi:MAG: NADH-quinone oxidoreductase subunit N [Anaerolineales bacterium]|nr:NADH-quinone oxidoreductase subunit N [Anaerolineales bacterium]
MTIEPFAPAQLLAVLPELLLIVLAGVIIAVDLALPAERKREVGLYAAIGFGLVLSVALLVTLPTVNGQMIFGGMLRNDLTAFIFRMLFLFAGALTALISVDAPTLGRAGEYYVILIAAVLGMGLMAASADLIMLYLAIELTSIGLYALAGFLRENDKSSEAGLKYFLFGAFTSSIMLYGFSLLYGFTGQTNLYTLAVALIGAPLEAMVLALLLVLVGFGFKVSAVPFHFWAPDVYEGAPTPVTAFLAVASKAAGFAVLIRVLMAVFPGIAGIWTMLIAVIAALTMTLGNVVALTQKNIKRLLAYSSIAQAGYMLMGLAAVSPNGLAAILYYLGMYALTNLAAFGVIILVSRITGSDEIADYAGLSRRSPGLALALLVAFLSLGGIPPLAGFFGKFYLFTAVMQQWQATGNATLLALVIAGVVNAIIALYYYLIVLKVVYLGTPKDEAVVYPVSRPYVFALWACAAGVIFVGAVIGPWVGIATTAAGGLF